MKWNLAIVAALLFASASAQAERLQEGTMELGGFASFNVSSEATRYTDATEKASAYAAAEVEYFFREGASAGMIGSFATKGVRPVYSSLGPVASYYFMVQENLAPYVSATPIMWVNASGAPAELASNLKIGAKYFLTDSVAVGPALDYTYFWGRDELPSVSRISLLAAFAVHY